MNKVIKKKIFKKKKFSKDNLFHGFGKFLALPGSGSVLSETDPVPAK